MRGVDAGDFDLGFDEVAADLQREACMLEERASAERDPARDRQSQVAIVFGFAAKSRRMRGRR